MRKLDFKAFFKVEVLELPLVVLKRIFGVNTELINCDAELICSSQKQPTGRELKQIIILISNRNNLIKGSEMENI